MSKRVRIFLAALALAVVAIVTNVGKSLNTLYDNVNTQVDSAGRTGA